MNLINLNDHVRLFISIMNNQGAKLKSIDQCLCKIYGRNFMLS